jgi:hypothetical protein
MSAIYQITPLFVSSDNEAVTTACSTLQSVSTNASAYGLSILGVDLDGTGHLRVTLNEPLYPSEVESFGGTIVEV